MVKDEARQADNAPGRKLTPEEMLELMRRHDAAEAAGDVEAVMATVAPEPFYEFMPLGYRINNRDTVAEFYRRTLPVMSRSVAAATQHNTWFNEDGYATEFEFKIKNAAGEDHVSAIIAAFTFENGLMKSERAFMDPEFAAMVDAALGPDFIGLPGVSIK